MSVAWFLSLKIKKGAMFYKKGAMLKTLRPFYVFDFNKFFFENRTKNEQRAQRAQRAQKSLFKHLYICVKFYLYAYKLFIYSYIK